MRRRRILGFTTPRLDTDDFRANQAKLASAQRDVSILVAAQHFSERELKEAIEFVKSNAYQMFSLGEREFWAGFPSLTLEMPSTISEAIKACKATRKAK